MPTLVQKYGGSSVATRERIHAVAERVVAAHAGGNRVAVVVSAMGDTTDDLMDHARALAHNPAAREMDFLLATGELVSTALMAMAVTELGTPAVALTGAQAGLATDGRYGRGRVVTVDPTRVSAEMRAGRVAIVAGFQGAGPDGDTVTLGRGGSDTSAVALAVALRADRCEIYTDVEGIYTADPRIVGNARKIDSIMHEEILEMAKLGARVMHPRSVEIAQIHEMPVVVRSSFSENVGTEIVTKEAIGIETMQRVRAIVHDTDVGKITIRGVSDRPGLAHAIFRPLADQSINVDVILQDVSEGGFTDVSFTVSRADLQAAVAITQGVAKDIGAREVAVSDKLAKVSVVGVGIQSTPGVAARTFGALSEEGINITGISTSEIRITCLVDSARAEDAVRALHQAFGLDKA